MGLRITTWNVNGIRNPFGYQPWRDKRTFAAMFDILEADIVVFQETKIQRKDLTDDVVLVPGWDCYFSLPRHKKGYSGVVIYTRQSVCTPIRAEEGITGILCPRNSSQSFFDLPENQQIGGYPTTAQLATSVVDATTLDSEGRCVILEFPAFVLFGVYSPANRDETRDDFRLGFLKILDSRIRNLISEGRRIVLTGDLNISREELDAANAEASMRKQGLVGYEYVSTPARRIFNHLLEGGKVFGERDEGRDHPVMYDICRGFHPDRKGMYTCWEQKVNARPGNCGARIDYVLCSLAMKGWFTDSNIQEGLMGSDHCPVYAVTKDKIHIDGEERYIQDAMNPEGMFWGGVRQRDYSTANDPLPMSGRLIPEFVGRRNIRDMFARKPCLQQLQSEPAASGDLGIHDTNGATPKTLTINDPAIATESAEMAPTASPVTPKAPSVGLGRKRSLAEASSSTRTLKCSKSTSSPAIPSPVGKGQQNLKGFFKPKAAAQTNVASVLDGRKPLQAIESSHPLATADPPLMGLPQEEKELESHNVTLHSPHSAISTQTDINVGLGTNAVGSKVSSPLSACHGTIPNSDNTHDPIETKESWSKLFTKPAAPKCEGHDEPCITLLTKKPGMNMGRSFWMCPRPLGPSGAKEKNTQWRCHTFIWCSDWNPNSANGG